MFCRALKQNKGCSAGVQGMQRLLCQPLERFRVLGLGVRVQDLGF